MVHRPDFDAFRKECPQQRDLGTKNRDYSMWPYINQEDLVRPKTLLLLLNAQARHPPCEFAAADREAMHFGTVTKALVPIFLNEYTIERAIGNLSIISQCMSQLDLFQPWARSFKDNRADKKAAIQRQFAERTKLWAKIMAALQDKDLPSTTPEKQGDGSGSSQHVPTKTKTKTRGQSSQDIAPVATARSTEPAAPDQPPLIPLDARANKVFRTLYFDPAVTSCPARSRRTTSSTQ
ncbi:Uncharacterized protein TPAR_01531 [Tolypocladium paradoxum]|uniref:Uncharacterized protein n=1 Tax=Tolypocladium paradoxum TaxID=94208 RepID=A0A2S4L799_9HYPO|nr:Uncharacterized protein TPAR_01531 [Tolypocladium paradoxum]